MNQKTLPKQNTKKSGQKPRKYSDKIPKKFTEKKVSDKWECRICQSLN